MTAVSRNLLTTLLAEPGPKEMHFQSPPDHNEDDADVHVPTSHRPGESDLHLIKKDLDKKEEEDIIFFSKVILKRRDGSLLRGKRSVPRDMNQIRF